MAREIPQGQICRPERLRIITRCSGVNPMLRYAFLSENLRILWAYPWCEGVHIENLRR